jgi:hypothetical protein
VTEQVLGQNVQVETEPVLLYKGSKIETLAGPKDNYKKKKKQEDREDENKRLKMRLMLI